MSTSDPGLGMPTSETLQTGEAAAIPKQHLKSWEDCKISIRTLRARTLRGNPGENKTATSTTDGKAARTRPKVDKEAKDPAAQESAGEGKKKRNLQLKWVAGTPFLEETLSMEYKPSETKRINAMQGHHIHVRNRVEVALPGCVPRSDGGAAVQKRAYSYALPVGWRRKRGGKNVVPGSEVHLEVLLLTAAGPGTLHLVQHQVLQAAREDPQHEERKKGHVPGVTDAFISEHCDALIWADIDSEHMLSVGYEQWDFFLRAMGFGPAMDIALFEPAPNSAAGGFWVNLEGMFASRHNTSRIDANPLTAPGFPQGSEYMDIFWDKEVPDSQVTECQSTFHLLTFSRCKFGEVGVTGAWTIESDTTELLMRWNALGPDADVRDAYEYLVDYVTKVHKSTAPGVVHLCDGCLQEGDGVGLFRLLLQPRMQGGPKASEGRSKYQGGCTEFLGIPEGTTLTSLAGMCAVAYPDTPAVGWRHLTCIVMESVPQTVWKALSGNPNDAGCILAFLRQVILEGAKSDDWTAVVPACLAETGDSADPPDPTRIQWDLQLEKEMLEGQCESPPQKPTSSPWERTAYAKSYQASSIPAFFFKSPLKAAAMVLEMALCAKPSGRILLGVWNNTKGQWEEDKGFAAAVRASLLALPENPSDHRIVGAKHPLVSYNPQDDQAAILLGLDTSADMTAAPRIADTSRKIGPSQTTTETDTADSDQIPHDTTSDVVYIDAPLFLQCLSELKWKNLDPVREQTDAGLSVYLSMPGGTQRTVENMWRQREEPYLLPMLSAFASFWGICHMTTSSAVLWWAKLISGPLATQFSIWPDAVTGTGSRKRGPGNEDPAKDLKRQALEHRKKAQEADQKAKEADQRAQLLAKEVEQLKALLAAQEAKATAASAP